VKLCHTHTVIINS